MTDPEDQPMASTASDVSTAPFELTLELPAVPRSVRPARAVIAALATDLGMDLDEIDDLRVALQESLAIVLDGATGPVTMRAVLATDAIEVELAAEGGGSIPDDAHVGRQLLDVLCASHEFGIDDGRRWCRLRSHAPEAA